ncbi:hypothetical protein RJ641_028946 [Dillenia turbinata]|uniref:Uncharacterized protein n=1 Tax=Dillenia turbinata TaxID=194707 RepID=A0AAN8VSJ2_9MAGN
MFHLLSPEYRQNIAVELTYFKCQSSLLYSDGKADTTDGSSWTMSKQEVGKAKDVVCWLMFIYFLDEQPPFSLKTFLKG